MFHKLHLPHPLLLGLGIVATGLLCFGIGELIFWRYQVSHLESPLVDTDEFHNPLPVLPAAPAASAAAIHIPIFMYHYIEHVKDPNDTIRQKLDIYPEILDKQLATLTQAGFTFLYVSQVGRILDGQELLPPKPIVLTFDDGYQDFYTDALPVLEKYHVKATAYIITSFLNHPNYMTTKQLLAVQASGIIELGAHTMHHIDLQHATLAKATTEIVGSKTALEQLLQEPIQTFAYPGGRFNPQTIGVVSQAGFSVAVSTLPGTEASRNNRFILFRLRPGSRTGARLLAFIDLLNRQSPLPAAKSQPE